VQGKEFFLPGSGKPRPPEAIQRVLEQMNIENVHLLCKDLPANPCHEIVAGGLCPPLSDNLKVNVL
jgi:hypothetical protein